MTTSTRPVRRQINLLRGWPSPSLHPTSQLESAAQTVLTTPSISTPALQYGPDPGYEPLRVAISSWLSNFYSSPTALAPTSSQQEQIEGEVTDKAEKPVQEAVKTSLQDYSSKDDPERICITGGASQNLACALQVFTDPGVTRAIWMVAPCYFLACRIFEDAGFAGRLRAVREDEEGIDLTWLEREIEILNEKELQTERKRFKAIRPWSKVYDHIIYAVPTFSNPSAKTMTLRRREQLVDLARRHNALIITDDVYDFLQWSTSTIPASVGDIVHTAHAILPRLSDIDRTLEPLESDPMKFGHTMSNGSFSKILGPGVRTGWTDSSPALSYALSQCGSSRSGGCASQLTATIISQLVVNGSLQKHIDSLLCPAYAKRWNLMMKAVDQYLLPLGVEASRTSLEGKDVFGGYFVWLSIPEKLNAEAIANISKTEEDLIVAHGQLFEVYGDESAVSLKNRIRLCFAWLEEKDIVEGVERLGRVIERMIVGKHPAESVLRITEEIRKPLGEI